MRLILVALTGLVFISSHSYADSKKIPNIPDFNVSSVKTLISRSSISSENVKKHNGFKVVDSNGNEFYVDNIEKPRNAVYMNKIINNSNRPINQSNITTEINIGSICFNLTCN